MRRMLFSILTLLAVRVDWAEGNACESLFIRSAPFFYSEKSLTTEEKRILKDFHVVRDGTYDRFTKLDRVQLEFADFLRNEIGSTDETANTTISAIIQRNAMAAVRTLGKETGWLTVRLSKPNHLFDLPRWHYDGWFFKPSPDETVYKFAQALKGPSTLFLEIPDGVRMRLKELLFDRDMNDYDRRLRIAELLSSYQRQSPPNDRGVYFVVGSGKIDGIHSEPPINEDRIFFSVVPGSVAEINELAARWGASTD